MVASSAEVEPYGFDPAFERTLGVLAATTPRFWGAAGYALDPSALRLPEVKLIVKAARAIAKDTGRGPASAVLLVQRLRRWVGEGSTTVEQVHDVMDLLLEAPTPPPFKEVVAEVSPILQRRIQQDVVRVAIDEYGKRGDFERVKKMVRASERVGVHDLSEGLRFGLSSFDEMERLKHLERFPLGIPDVDAILNGGLPRGTCTVFVAKSGGGKSMMLSHVASTNLRKGLFCVYATLELSEVEIIARVTANITGVDIDKIKDGHTKEAKRRVRAAMPQLGTFLVKSFPAKATTVGDIRDWVSQCEESEGYPVDVVVIDYGQKLRSHQRENSEYEAQGTVYEEFRLWMEQTGKVGFTGSQAKRKAGKDAGRILDVDDIAESMKQVHVADLVITLNRDEDQITYGGPKWRLGESEWSVGPIPHDWARGRMVVIDDPPLPKRKKRKAEWVAYA
jgi:KaiC/GvpD/RAD55 family RecA-like ATPase